ncbi:dTDP-4-dehydrorhamnose 3,5-epimerase [Vreelandella venusta]|uniref:dTDP-4-dehydrorhamnose 3,5-epimerase n=1 Tax=Vreelandella venusta TaxID=44935 RepID=A0AAP9ZB47_9GAMM|nr:dTDP-4-dehydrorhamnose 3,5-epimerase [Halomonas venusta]AZM96635.1 dTDP-4-dehydrorhamnose 3,5-epimerase [Halomonas venusta]NPT30045.1 dTDP-4-dehydrorhamnose 3,5-epimerase [Halomonas venusta]QRL02101.1 dTDP-4-dehydrorhamnose 3,5-epimerase [Halomonas venusta]UQI39374.1 dTDP-4-dehydrorhamnose 3,5-epimerase [Halomonas venusta]GEK53136.1 dTDP-4-dehydrorhamnose 3,5-epimerase [Halomonas venusta]
MQYEKLAIPDVVLITPQVFGDERGFFMETFRQNEFEDHCGHYTFVQDNHSKSTHGILRGLHYQHQQPQGKLVRVTQGEVFDVAVDMRQSSPTYGQWVGATLSEQNKQMLWVPPGFAHGFYVTSETAEFQYKCTDYYAPGDEVSILWNDPQLAIQWPTQGQKPRLSAKDEQGLAFKAAPAFD